MRHSRLLFLALAIVHSLIAYALLCGVLCSCAWKFEFWARHEIFFRPLYPIGAGFYAALCVRYLLSWKFSLCGRVFSRKVQSLESTKCLFGIVFESLLFMTHCFVIVCFVSFVMPIIGEVHCLIYIFLIFHFLIHCHMTYTIAVYVYKTNRKSVLTCPCQKAIGNDNEH